MVKHICIICFLCFSCSGLYAQDKNYVYQDSTIISTEPRVDTAVAIDPLTIEGPVAEDVDTVLHDNHLKMPADSIGRWKELPDFAYAKYLDSLLKVRQTKEKPKATKYESPKPNWLDDLFSSAVVQFILWTLAAVFVLFILYKLFLADGVFRKTAKANTAVVPEVTEEVITADSDFEAMILQALRAGNYRLAVRYHYLRALHKLADKGLVKLAADKTNYQYVREIRDQQYRNDFSGLTLSYEYVWYGEFPIGENIYRKIEYDFSAFNQKI